MIATVTALMAVAALPPPPLVITIPDPAKTLPRLVDAHQWVSAFQPDLAPRRLRRHAKVLGIDPFDAKTLSNIGVKAGAKIRVWSDERGDVVVLELALSHPKKADAALQGVFRPDIAARGIVKRSGFVVGSSASTGVAALRDGKRLFLSIGSGARGLAGSNPFGVLAKAAAKDKKNPPKPRPPVELDDARLAPIIAASKAKAPRVPPPILRKRPNADLWVQGRELGKLDRLDGTVYLTDGGVEAEWHASLGVGLELALSEAVRTTARSRALLSLPKAASSITANLHFSGIREVVKRLAPSLSPKVDAANVFTGAMHVVLAESGELVLAAEVGRRVQAKSLGAVARAARARWPAVKSHSTKAKDGRRLALFWFGEATPAMIEGTLLAKPGPKRPAIEFTGEPFRLPEAITLRSAANDGVGLPTAQLLLFRLMAQPILNATKMSQVELQPQSGRVRGKAIVRYR